MINIISSIAFKNAPMLLIVGLWALGVFWFISSLIMLLIVWHSEVKWWRKLIQVVFAPIYLIVLIISIRNW
jgi:hypothetical protein